METKLQGLCVIALTPFKEDGALDERSLRNLVDFYIGRGVHGLTILGIMGEAHKLLESERQRVLDIVMEQNAGRVPVVVGCTANSTHVAVHLAQKAEEAGAAAVMVAPPQNVKNEALLLEHYTSIADSISIPIVLQDEPVTTGVILTPDFIARLANTVPSIQYVKLEEAPTPVKITKILEKTDRLEIFGGLGGGSFYEEMARGASGIMTGFAFPEILVNVYDLFTSGNQEEARSYFYKHLPLIRFEFQLGIGGVAIRKETFKLRGAIGSSHVRVPAAPLDLKTMDEFKELVDYLGVAL
jgi:4-hydroxy-tetrahydrodipicolinate synthase